MRAASKVHWAGFLSFALKAGALPSDCMHICLHAPGSVQYACSWVCACMQLRPKTVTIELAEPVPGQPHYFTVQVGRRVRRRVHRHAGAAGVQRKPWLGACILFATAAPSSGAV